MRLSTRSRFIAAAAVVASALVTTRAVGHAFANAVADDPPAISLYAALSERKLYLRAGDSTVHEFVVAVGRDSKPTPKGDYKIRKIIWNPAWIPPDEGWARGKRAQAPGAPENPMKLVKIFFQEPDYYIHGTNEIESLGDARSHGCLRMDPDDAYELAKYLMDHGGQPRDDGWFYRVLHFRSETKNVYLDHPIPFTVAE